ncbi:MAG: hypothetical protein OXC99_13105 [Chloroflexi bacterium]|nr:hypothetical protein [Chloroflexota bacterium]
MGSLTDNKLSGLALMAGVVLVIVLLPLTPGSSLPSEDALNYYALTEAMVDGGMLTIITAWVAVLAMFLFTYGFIALWRNAPSRGAGTLVRMGAVGLIVFAVIITVSQGLDLIILHVVEHGIGRGTGGTEAAALSSTAATLQAAKFGITYIAILMAAVGFLLLCIGMLGRIQSMNLHKAAAIIMIIAMPTAGVATVLTEIDHDLLAAPLLPVVAVCTVLVFIYPLLLGWGLYKGSAGYVEESAG